ncbi:hypothetical protein L484_000376 [Morus notabilis]|uniref:Uncharacterized protein n=1 Tax=Morus notabilis TaxID=981085 RepID=W9SF18_9ROSA|nr:hypothetical protein L484_000376 [Morus notabilis]
MDIGALWSSTMSGHVGRTGAHIFVAKSARWHAIAPLAARDTCPFAHVLPRRFTAAPVITL